jgi:hypothetical protein
MTSHRGTLTFLQISALLVAALGVLQAVLGLVIVSGSWVTWHGDVGNLTVVVTLVAAVAAVLWRRVSGNTGLMMHAIGMLVLAVAMVALGEMGLRWPHVAVGVLFLVGSVALGTLAYRKPGAPVLTR